MAARQIVVRKQLGRVVDLQHRHHERGEPPDLDRLVLEQSTEPDLGGLRGGCLREAEGDECSPNTSEGTAEPQPLDHARNAPSLRVAQSCKIHWRVDIKRTSSLFSTNNYSRILEAT